MSVKWLKASFLGVRSREHSPRKHGIRPDRCYRIRYKTDGKDKEEVVGWSSEGITQEIAFKRLSESRENLRSGTGAKTLEEKRLLAEAEEEAERQAKLREENRIYRCVIIGNKAARNTAADKEGIVLSFRGWPHAGMDSSATWQFAPGAERIRGMGCACSEHELEKLSQRAREYVAGTLRRLMRHAQDRGLPMHIPTSKQIGVQAPKDIADYGC